MADTSVGIYNPFEHQISGLSCRKGSKNGSIKTSENEIRVDDFTQDFKDGDFRQR